MVNVNTYTQNTYTHVFRFAPSPNGYLHLGHAYSALLNYDMARETGGRLLLRIEDIDTPRSRPEYETAIYEDLEWLGISWQQPVRRQSEHFADYESALFKLNALALLYPSFESRSEIAALVAERDRYGRWPRDPMACRFIRAAPANCRPPSASAASMPARLMLYASPSMRRWRRPAC